MLIGSLNFSAANQIGQAQSSLASNFRRLSSGMRITQAADDAAGLSVASKLSAMVSGLEQASRNASDAISVTQVADGAMSSQGDALIRMRELATQAANGTLNDSDRAALQKEFDSLRSEIDNVAQGTNFNGQPLLQGGTVNMQVGPDGTAGSQVALNTSDTSAAALGITTTNIGTQAGAQAALADVDQAIQTVANARGDVGAAANRFSSARNNLGTAVENTYASLSRIRDADIAGEASSMAGNSLQLRAAISVQQTANSMRGMLVNLIG